jgi:hypothetical protein
VEAEKAAFIAELEAEQHAEWMARVEAEDAALMAAAEAEAERRAQAAERHEQEMEERAERLAAIEAEDEERREAAFELAAAEKRAAEEVTAKQIEERQKQIDAAREMVNTIGKLIQGIGDFWSTMYDRRIADAQAASDAALEAEIERLEALGLSEEELAKRIRDVKEQYAQEASDEISEIRRKQAIADKAFAIADATIQGAAAVARVAWNPVLAGIVAATVAAQIATISATPIPEAELGGSFVVPPGNNSDGALMRVSSGERVDVTPARASDSGGEMPSTVVVRIGEREFAAAVEDAFNRGGAQIRRQGAVRVRR